MNGLTNDDNNDVNNADVDNVDVKSPQIACDVLSSLA